MISFKKEKFITWVYKVYEKSNKNRDLQGVHKTPSFLYLKNLFFIKLMTVSYYLQLNKPSFNY